MCLLTPISHVLLSQNSAGLRQAWKVGQALVCSAAHCLHRAASSTVPQLPTPQPGAPRAVGGPVSNSQLVAMAVQTCGPSTAAQGAVSRKWHPACKNEVSAISHILMGLNDTLLLAAPEQPMCNPTGWCGDTAPCCVGLATCCPWDGPAALTVLL